MTDSEARIWNEAIEKAAFAAEHMMIVVEPFDSEVRQQMTMKTRAPSQSEIAAGIRNLKINRAENAEAR